MPNACVAGQVQVWAVEFGRTENANELNGQVGAANTSPRIFLKSGFCWAANHVMVGFSSTGVFVDAKRDIFFISFLLFLRILFFFVHFFMLMYAYYRI